MISFKTRLNYWGNDIKATEEKLQINGITMINCQMVGGGIGIG